MLPYNEELKFFAQFNSSSDIAQRSLFAQHCPRMPERLPCEAVAMLAQDREQRNLTYVTQNLTEVAGRSENYKEFKAESKREERKYMVKVL